MNAENHWTWPEYSSQICMYLRDKAIIDHWLSREIQWSKQWQAFLISTSIFSHKRTKISSFSVMFFFFFWFHFLKAYNCQEFLRELRFKRYTILHIHNGYVRRLLLLYLYIIVFLYCLVPTTGRYFKIYFHFASRFRDSSVICSVRFVYIFVYFLRGKEFRRI